MNDEDDGFEVCANCGGEFDRADMDGEHCRECSAQIFGDD